MNHLPWLVVHGDLVWQVALAVVLATSIFWGRVLRGLVLQRGSQARGRNLGPAKTSVRALAGGQRVVLEGVLEAGGRLCTRMDDGSQAAAMTADHQVWLGGPSQHRLRAGELALVLEGGRVVLDGAVHVIAGSQELHGHVLHGRAAIQRASLHVPKELLARHRRCTVRSVLPGDRVRVAGCLRAEPMRQEHGAGAAYRELAARWVLCGEPELLLAAARPHVSPLPWWTIAARTVLVALLFGLAAQAMGFLARASAVHADERREAEYLVRWDAPAGQEGRFHWHSDQLGKVHAAAEVFPIDPLDSLVLASMLPGERDSALARLRDRLARYAMSSPERAEAAIALADLHARCRHGSMDRIALGRVREGTQIAKDCELPWIMAEGHALLAEFDQASDAIEAGKRASQSGHDVHPERYARVPLLAQRWRSAAAALAHWGAKSLQDREAAQCMALAAQARAGDLEARRMLVSASLGAALPICTLLRADLAEGQERVALLRKLDLSPRGHGADASAVVDAYGELRALLLAEADPGALAADQLTWLARTDRESRIKGLFLMRTESLSDVLAYHGLKRAALRRLMAEPSLAAHVRELRAHLAMDAAILDILAGKPDTALSWTDSAIADAERLANAEAPRLLAQARLLKAVVLYRAGDARAARDLLAASRGTVMAHADIEAVLALRLDGEISDRLKEQYQDNFLPPDGAMQMMRAMAGDGHVIAEALWTARDKWPLYLGAVGPRVVQGRERLIEVLRWSQPFSTRIEELGNRLWIMETLGADDLASEQRAAMERLYEAYLQREPSVLVTLLR